jgi:hypothetical protein
MGFLSTTSSITRYFVKGDLENPITETVTKALKANTIQEIDRNTAQTGTGWTSFTTPYVPDFNGNRFVFGSLYIFSLRIDKKSIPAKVLNKHIAQELAQQTTATGGGFISTSRKEAIKDKVSDQLSLRTPASPNIFDLVWDYEAHSVWLMTTQKAANEALESLFFKSFKVPLIRLFPYTQVQLLGRLDDAQKDQFANLAPTKFNS